MGFTIGFAIIFSLIECYTSYTFSMVSKKLEMSCDIIFSIVSAVCTKWIESKYFSSNYKYSIRDVVKTINTLSDFITASFAAICLFIGLMTFLIHLGLKGDDVNILIFKCLLNRSNIKDLLYTNKRKMFRLIRVKFKSRDINSTINELAFYPDCLNDIAYKIHDLKELQNRIKNVDTTDTEDNSHFHFHVKFKLNNYFMYDGFTNMRNDPTCRDINKLSSKILNHKD